MKKIFVFITISLSIFSFSQLENISTNEVLTYRIHYGLINAGTAELKTSKITYKGKPHLRAIGTGKTTGVVHTFFKVHDIYESYMNLDTGEPSFYVRNILEGNYRRHFETRFNHGNQTLELTNKLKNTSQSFKTVKGIQDMISSFYHLRSVEDSKLKVGNSVKMNIWIDDESYSFVLKVVGKEVKKTKFGKISCLKIIPSVMSGRVFKREEGVTMWVTDDKNRIPVELKAELAVGSLKADLSSYKNVKYSLNFTK